MSFVDVDVDKLNLQWGVTCIPIAGRCSFTRRLKQQADQVSWHASGDFYMLVSSKSVQVFRASDNSCMGTCALDSRINKACFTQSSKADSCLVASSSLETKGEDGFIEGCRVAAVCEDKTISIFDMHGRQVEILSSLNCCLLSDYYTTSNAQHCYYLTTDGRLQSEQPRGRST